MKKEEEERLAAEKKAEEEKKAEAKKVEDKKAAEQKKLEDKKLDEAKPEPKKDGTVKKLDEKPATKPKKEDITVDVVSEESNKDDVETDTKDRAPDLKTMHMKIDPKKRPADDKDGDGSPIDENLDDERPEDKAPLTKIEPKVNIHSKRDNARRDKLSDVEKEAYKSFENCGEACKENSECFQWVWYDMTCRLQTSFRLGNYQAPSEDGKVVYKSGWMVDKINEWTAENTCKEARWD